MNTPMVVQNAIPGSFCAGFVRPTFTMAGKVAYAVRGKV